MEISSALLELASVSLACRDQDTLLKTFAARVGATIGARAVLIWLGPSDREGLSCRMRWAEPGEKINPAEESATDGLLAEIVESSKVLRLTAREIVPDNLSHLDDVSRLRVKSALYAPLPGTKSSEGVVEVLNKRTGEFSEEDALFLEGASRLVAQSFTNLEAIEVERRQQLFTLERLTSLYDLGRTFTSTLEIGMLLPIVAEKIRDILSAGACNLWLLEPGSDELHLSQQAGKDPTVELSARVSLADTLLGEIAHRASPRLVENPSEEPGLKARTGGEFKIDSWMAAPLRKDDEVLGVVELLNKSNSTAFDEDDLFFLASISEQAAVALHNSNLLESERKVHVLDALLKISQEITSTLDLDRVLTTVVNHAATILPFDRCVIGFFDRGRFVLGAVSGEKEVPKTREMDDLRQSLEWVAHQNEHVSADFHGEDDQVEPASAHALMNSFLKKHQYNGFYGFPLRDDQGALGAMALLSGEPDFLTERNRDTLAILGNQTTVAIRNAQLYQQVPLATFFHPLARRTHKLLSAMPQDRWSLYAERAGVAILFLVLCPWPMRVMTNVTIVPAERRIVSTIKGGVLQRVLVHEGDFVQPGQTLGELEDGDGRVKLAQASAALAQARRDQAEAEFRNDPSLAGQAKIRADLHATEVRFDEDRLSASELRAPIAGIVVTPKVEEKVGTMLKPGDGFCEVVVQDRMAAEMSVEETDLDLVQAGKDVAVKLNAFPTTTFQGMVDRIGTQTQASAGEQYFLVRALLPNPKGLARDGMVGRARIRATGGWFQSGWYPVGYVLFRSPFRAAWRRIWRWLP